MTRLDAKWVRSPESRAVMAALDGQGFFVGGCVRNALLDAPVADIDVATPLVPDAVISRLEDAGLKAVPTGIAHGTVTAIHEGAPVEVTTFRADVETDGRRAVVAFTTDISVDAARRDFTMNALYADREGQLVDPLGGLPDLRARRVRFIGAAEDRIREDYLRILRFFRFHAWYGADGIDADGLAACAELADGIEALARERIGWEIRKLLSAPDPAPAVSSMAASGVLLRCLPGASTEFLPPLVHLEASAGIAPDWKRRLVVLGGAIAQTDLRLSNAEDKALSAIRAAMSADEPVDAAAYRHGDDAAVSAALIRAASVAQSIPAGLLEEARRGAAMRFPVTAGNLLSSGVPEGPEIGALLKQLEERWIGSGFSLGKDALLAGIPADPKDVPR
ncbi:MAG: CCA tRNA nucleotidyltransferase [Pseudomonadota bacterium]